MNRIFIVFICVVFIDAILKKINIFDEFIEGVKSTFSIVPSLFTTMVAFMLFVQCLKCSGFIECLQNIFTPVCDFLNIPIDIIVLALLRPISANASLSYLYQFYTTYGVDHALSLLATLIQCGSDTTLYVISLYFSSLRIKNTRYSIYLGLFLDFLAVVFSLIIYLKTFA